MSEFQSASPEPQKRGTNPWKWVAIGCGGLIVAFILIIAALSVFVARNVQVSMDPVETEAKARSLFTYDFPNGSTGFLTMNMFGIEFVQVSDGQDPPTILLTVGRFPGIIAQSSDQQAYVEGFQDSYTGEQQFELQEQRTEERELCDQTVPVTIQIGQLQPSGQREAIPAVNYLAIVEREAADQFAWIATNGEQAEANAEALFNSLDCVN